MGMERFETFTEKGEEREKFALRTSYKNHKTLRGSQHCSSST